MPKLTVTYEGGKKLKALVRQHVIPTDQVGKAGGTDTAANPLETFVASLGMCMGYFASAYLENHGFRGDGLALEVDWDVGGKPKRLTRFAATIRLPEGVELGPKARALVAAAKNCPVHNSLREDVDVSLEVVSGGAMPRPPE